MEGMNLVIWNGVIISHDIVKLIAPWDLVLMPMPEEIRRYKVLNGIT